MTDHKERAERFNQALALWFDLTNLDPHAQSFTIGEFGLRRATEEVVAARLLDPTDITASMMLSALADGYFKQQSFPVTQLLDDPDRVVAYLSRARDFRNLIDAPDMRAIGDEFADAVQRGLAHYGAEREDVLALVQNRHELAYLRRDALRSMATLRVDQFLTGDPEPEGVLPQYLDTVHEFWNVNSLLQAMVNMPSGAMMALIRDPDAFQSYFVFAIRNGGRLFLLSDIDKQAHPLQRYMSRRPDRALANRIERNWFPYHLLDFKVSDEGKIYFEAQSDGTGLVPYQAHSVRLKPIRELGAQETIWATMMLNLIVDRFWTRRMPDGTLSEGEQQPELSYTGEMIQVQANLIEHAERTGIAVHGYQPINVRPLTVDQVRTDAVDPDHVGRRYSHDSYTKELQNEWLEQRYADKIEGSMALNLLALPSHNGLYLPGKGDAESVVKLKDLPEKWHSAKDNRQSLHTQDPTSFGTRERLLADRVFIARHNFAKQIQILADQEFEARKEEIRMWFRDRVIANVEALLPFAAYDQVSVQQTTGGNVSFCDPNRSARHTFSRRLDLDDKETIKYNYLTGFGATQVSKGWNHAKKRSLCWINGGTARYKVVFTPHFISDLCLLVGLPRHQLPDVLQNWQREEDYVANSILQRVDPMVWALHNPWRKLNLEAVIAISQRGFKQIVKDAKQPSVGEYNLIDTRSALTTGKLV